MWYFRWGMVGCGLIRQIGLGREVIGWIRSGRAVMAFLGAEGCGMNRQSRWRRKRWDWVGFGR